MGMTFFADTLTGKDCKSRWMLFSLLFVISLSGTVAADSKMDFWNQQRKGANGFNAQPDEAWFLAARQLGVEWVRLTFSKWKGQERDFLFGSLDKYSGLVDEDLQQLRQVLDWAHKHQIKVVIVPLSLPGNRWIQHNHGQRDMRLWQDKSYWDQSVAFWSDLASELKDHPAVYGYNLINEPVPEMDTDIAEQGDPSRYIDWYQQYRESARDLPAFYERLVSAIRAQDKGTPIMLDAGWYAQPNAFTYWKKLPDDKLLYSFHIYEPYAFTSPGNFRDRKNYSYPGEIPFAGEQRSWNKAALAAYLEPFFQWAKRESIAPNHLVAGEFGCFRRNKGCREYLADLIDLFNRHEIHWAFYSFREDEWDGYDYELGEGELGWKYWQAVEAGKTPELPRKNNPLFDVIKREFKRF
jgi:hypothetical protein